MINLSRSKGQGKDWLQPTQNNFRIHRGYWRLFSAWLLARVKTFEHTKAIYRKPDKMNAANLKINKKKWELVQKELIYLAHIIRKREFLQQKLNQCISCPAAQTATEFCTVTQHFLWVHQHSKVSRNARGEGGDTLVVSRTRSSTISIKWLAFLLWFQNPFHHAISWACRHGASSSEDLSFPGMFTVSPPKKSWKRLKSAKLLISCLNTESSRPAQNTEFWQHYFTKEHLARQRETGSDMLPPWRTSLGKTTAMVA